MPSVDRMIWKYLNFPLFYVVFPRESNKLAGLIFLLEYMAGRCEYKLSQHSTFLKPNILK